MDKKDVADVLAEIAALLELKNANPFRVRAYSNAARVIEGMPDASVLQDEEKLCELRGIGADLAGKICELARTGRMRFHQELKASLPPGLLQMIKIPGVGPKRAKFVLDQLGIDSIEKLEAAATTGRLAELKGFGEKLQRNILAGIESLRRFASRHRWSTAQEAAQPILEALRRQPGVMRCSVAGSLRRCGETIGDVDFLASADARDAERIIAAFTGLPDVLRVTARGSTKASVVLKGGVQADLRVVEDSQYAFALAYFTGNKEHNIALRGRALKLKGLSLNEYGFSPASELGRNAKELGSSVACRDEAELYRFLGLDYVPPELREGREELEAAAQGRLPKLVEAKDLRGAFHCHSDWSDGLQSMEAMVLGAQQLGWRFIGLADHSVSEYQAKGLDARRVARQLVEARRLQKRFGPKGLRVFYGTECDIQPDGRLDFDEETLGLFDYVIAAVHSHFQLESQAQTRRIVQALSHPKVTMLAHPTGRLLLQRPAYQVDLAAVIAAAAEHGKIIELNAHPHRFDLDWRWWKAAAQQGVRCAINPDAHCVGDLAYVEAGVGIARKGWLTKADVVNCLPVAQLERLLRVEPAHALSR